MRNEFGAKSLLLWVLLLSLTLIPFIGTMNDLMAKIAALIGLDDFIETNISPQMAVTVAALLTYVFGVEATALGPSIYLVEHQLPYRLILDWNCVGWQSLLLLLVSLVTGLQGDHSRLSRWKCILLGLLNVALLNLLRVSLDALILEAYGPTIAIAFHDYATLPLTFLWLAGFWYISTNYILTPRGSREAISLKALIDFLLGRRTLSAATMAIILLSTFLGGLTLLTMKVGADCDPTELSFEWYPNAVEVCGITTNRVMTHPDYTDLNYTPSYTDSYTGGFGWKEAWAFYLYGPLVEDYTISGKANYTLWLHIEDDIPGTTIIWTHIRFKIYDVDKDGDLTHVHTDGPYRIKLVENRPTKYEYEGDTISTYTFEEGHTIKLGVEIYVTPHIDYILEYDSETRHSYLELPGIVVEENVVALMGMAPLLPWLTRAFSRGRRGDEKD